MLGEILVGGVLGWPEDQVRDTLMIVVIVVVGILVPIVFILTRAYYKRDAARSSRWNMMMNQALRRGLLPGEIAHLRAFFETVSTEEADEFLGHPARYKQQLLDYMRHDRHSGARADVQLLDKLFPEMEWHIEIGSAKDLQVGEVCSVEFPKETHLGTIVKVHDPEILVSIPEWIPSVSGIQAGEETGLFVYRPGIGGFLLNGTVTKAGRNGFVYLHDGKVEPKGEHHLMAILEMPAVLVPWPHKEEEGGAQEEITTVDGAPAVPSPRDVPDQVQIRSVRISDRGMIFRAEHVVQSLRDTARTGSQSNVPGAPEAFISPSAAHDVLKKNELWELQMTLEDGFHFVCRVRAIPSNMGRGHFLAKFLDATETGRKVLMQSIRRHEPMREQLV